MAEGSMETLARSQLEMLYRLGILEQHSNDDIERQCIASKRDEKKKEHDAFLAALPPPSVMCSVPSRALQESIYDLESNSEPSREENCELFFSSLAASRRRRQLKSRRHHYLNSSSSLASSSSFHSSKQTRHALRLWFRQWKFYVLNRREKDRRQVSINVLSKQNCWTKWAFYSKQRQYRREKTLHLDSWKASRALSKWAQWKQRRILLRKLINSGRRSFMGRLIQQRVWSRWVKLTLRRKHFYRVLGLQTLRRHDRLVRCVWTGLRIHSYRARHDSIALRNCLRVMRNFCYTRKVKHSKFLQRQCKMNDCRKRRLLQRWKAYTVVSSRDRRLSWNVQNNLKRRRFLLLWCKVARDINHTDQLRSKVIFRNLYQHFQAWNIIARAIKRGTKVRESSEKHSRKFYFQVLKAQAKFGAHSKHVHLMMNQSRLATAVSHYYVWTTERRHIRDAMNRILSQRTSSEAVLYNHHIAVFEQMETQVIGGLKSYQIFCLEQHQRVAKAQSHLRRRLLKRGVLTLWRAVHGNAESSLQAYHFRRKLRVNIKKRHFRSWLHITKSRTFNRERLHELQKRLNLFFKLERRTWNRWVKFVTHCQRRDQFDRRYQVRRKHQILHRWNFQAKSNSRLRDCIHNKRIRITQTRFNHWKYCVGEWKKIRVVTKFAISVYEKNLCTRLIQEWRSCSSRFHRERKIGILIMCKRETKLTIKCLFSWRGKVCVRQCVSRLRCRRECQIVQKYFANWHNHVVLQNDFARKFRLVCTMYSTPLILTRAWNCWHRKYKKNECLKALHRTLQHEQVRQCFSRWKDFRIACYIIRVWHRIALAISNSTNRLGMRLRCFHKKRRHGLQRWIIAAWKRFVFIRRSIQERQSLHKHKLQGELMEVTRKLEQAATFCLKLWFRRWTKEYAVARRHFHHHLCSSVILSWWKATINSKQEKVVISARQTTDNPLYYHPQHQLYAIKAKRIDCLAKRKNNVLGKQGKKVVGKASSLESMRKMRRMLDPMNHVSYTKARQTSDADTMRNENCKQLASKLSAKAASGPSVNSRICRGVENGLEGGKRIHHAMIVTCRSYPNISKASYSEVQQEQMSPLLAATNQVDCDTNNVKIAKSLKRSQCVLPFSPDLQEKQANVSCIENDLPLFDSDVLDVKARTNETKRNAIARGFNSVADSEQRVSSQECHFKADKNDILASTTDPQLDLGHSCALKVGSNVRATSSGTQKRTTSSYEVKDSRKKPGVRKKRGAVQQIKILCSSRDDAKPLAEILKLNDGPEACSLKRNDFYHDNRQNSNWAASMIKKLIAFYADSILANASKSDELNSALIRVCFRMARDLALFQNDFYVEEFMKVYDASFKDKSTEDGQINLNLFLKRLIESHPAYRKYLDTTLHRTRTKTVFDWLARHHLQLHFRDSERANYCSQKTKSFWNKSSIPSEMDAALEKMFIVIKKYLLVLGQLFLRQAVESSLSAKNNLKDYRISISAFISLMKQVQMFPQLFHRRELEDAVCLSCCSSPVTKELNFPEFIETLVRCSCNLRWGELAGGKQATETKIGETVVIIKFVMLIFAMEGQGSVLRKRNDDVTAILDFIGQQQKKNQAEKIIRFRKLLADNKRRNKEFCQIPSVWNHIRVQYSPKHSSIKSLTDRSKDTFDGLTKSRENGIPRQSLPESSMSDVDSKHLSDDDFFSDATHPELSNFGPVECGKVTGDQTYSISGSIDEASSVVLPSVFDFGASCAADSRDLNRTGSIKSRDGKADPFKPYNCFSKVHSNSVPSATNLRKVESFIIVDEQATSLQSTGLFKPLKKDEFLREIVDCIGDVELLLNQSTFDGSNHSKLQNTQRRNTVPDVLFQGLLNTTFSSGYDEPSLSDIAEDTSLVYGWQQQIVDPFSTNEDSEVQIRDPLLNHLTDTERFTENNEYPDLVTLAGLAQENEVCQQKF
ncbi:hypothetical protein Plhal304r1_c068g0156011 [Plasmopara halstedii]